MVTAPTQAAAAIGSARDAMHASMRQVAQPDSPRGDGNSGANPQLRVDDGVAALQSYRGEGGLQSEEGWVGKLESKGVKKEKLPRCWNVSVFLSMFKRRDARSQRGRPEPGRLSHGGAAAVAHRRGSLPTATTHSGILAHGAAMHGGTDLLGSSAVAQWRLGRHGYSGACLKSMGPPTSWLLGVHEGILRA
uniref:Uncharacterized protein n=1 Tax=Oryza sativa subsp. japonica TaxID=39947 RepID=Q94H28_ORYSJ|nr:hypothetical protein [Oryza sativa Japonica Group]